MIILDRSSEMCDAGRSALAEVVATGAGWIIYTSGSTGSPKGVVLPRTSLASCGYGYSNGFGIGSGDRMLLCFPLGHAIGTHTAPGVALVSGATLALVEKFSVSRFWSDVEALGGTCMVLFPSQLTLLSEAKSAETVTGSPLRLVLTHQIHGPFQQRFPQIELGTVWGMTETGAVATGHRGGTLDDPNLVGGPLVPDAAVQILNPSGTPVPDGDVGEIAFRHPAGQMICYFREPELTAATLVDGYVRTGDLGVIGPKGLSFSGRVKNIIKRAGETIVADEVEHCVAQHDLVQECAVASVPDRVLTEEVGAVVCAREGADPLVIREWLRDHLAAWKLPRYWIVSSEPLPRLENHKVDRRMVADMLADQGLRLDLGERR